MSQRPFASNTDGRLNLEQQRKRAKELLPRLKSQDPSATLSQAQWQVAKQLGFASWPKLKAHVDAIDFAARHPGFEASDGRVQGPVPDAHGPVVHGASA